jgi:hypothetical protein
MSLTKKTLGRTGLEVTQLGFGAMEVRGNRIWGGRPCTEEQAETILNAVNISPNGVMPFMLQLSVVVPCSSLVTTTRHRTIGRAKTSCGILRIR